MKPPFIILSCLSISALVTFLCLFFFVGSGFSELTRLAWDHDFWYYGVGTFILLVSFGLALNSDICPPDRAVLGIGLSITAGLMVVGLTVALIGAITVTTYTHPHTGDVKVALHQSAFPDCSYFSSDNFYPVVAAGTVCLAPSPHQQELLSRTQAVGPRILPPGALADPVLSPTGWVVLPPEVGSSPLTLGWLTSYFTAGDHTYKSTIDPDLSLSQCLALVDVAHGTPWQLRINGKAPTASSCSFALHNRLTLIPIK